MSHHPLSYLPKHEISSPQLVLCVSIFFFWKYSKDVSIILRNQSVSCSHVTFILIVSSPLGLTKLLTPDCRSPESHWFWSRKFQCPKLQDSKGLKGCCVRHIYGKNKLFTNSGLYFIQEHRLCSAGSLDPWHLHIFCPVYHRIL